MGSLPAGRSVEQWDLSLVVVMVGQRESSTAFELVVLSVVLWASMMAVLKGSM